MSGILTFWVWVTLMTFFSSNDLYSFVIVMIATSKRFLTPLLRPTSQQLCFKENQFIIIYITFVSLSCLWIETWQKSPCFVSNATICCYWYSIVVLRLFYQFKLYTEAAFYGNNIPQITWYIHQLRYIATQLTRLYTNPHIPDAWRPAQESKF